MGSVMIGDFGIKNGVQTFRVCGAKDDLYKIIYECKDMDLRFDDIPIVNHVTRQQWTMLLKIKIPVEKNNNPVNRT